MNYFCCDKELPVFQGWARKRHGSAKPASAKWKAWPAHYVWHKCGTQWQVAIKMLVTATSGEGVGVCAHGGRNPSAGVRAAHAGRRGRSGCCVASTSMRTTTFYFGHRGSLADHTLAALIRQGSEDFPAPSLAGHAACIEAWGMTALWPHDDCWRGTNAGNRDTGCN